MSSRREQLAQWRAQRTAGTAGATAAASTAAPVNPVATAAAGVPPAAKTAKSAGMPLAERTNAAAPAATTTTTTMTTTTTSGARTSAAAVGTASKRTSLSAAAPAKRTAAATTTTTTIAGAAATGAAAATATAAAAAAAKAMTTTNTIATARMTTTIKPAGTLLARARPTGMTATSKRPLDALETDAAAAAQPITTTTTPARSTTPARNFTPRSLRKPGTGATASTPSRVKLSETTPMRPASEVYVNTPSSSPLASLPPPPADAPGDVSTDAVMSADEFDVDVAAGAAAAATTAPQPELDSVAAAATTSTAVPATPSTDRLNPRTPRTLRSVLRGPAVPRSEAKRVRILSDEAPAPELTEAPEIAPTVSVVTKEEIDDAIHSGAAGTVITMEIVSAKRTLKTTLESDVVATPVRRSLRGAAKNGTDGMQYHTTADLLQQSQFCFAPNPAIANGAGVTPSKSARKASISRLSTPAATPSRTHDAELMALLEPSESSMLAMSHGDGMTTPAARVTSHSMHNASGSDGDATGSDSLLLAQSNFSLGASTMTPAAGAGASSSALGALMAKTPARLSGAFDAFGGDDDDGDDSDGKAAEAPASSSQDSAYDGHFAVVKLSARKQRQLGATVAVTPVRRSTRIASTPQMSRKSVEGTRTDFATLYDAANGVFVENPSLSAQVTLPAVRGLDAASVLQILRNKHDANPSEVDAQCVAALVALGTLPSARANKADVLGAAARSSIAAPSLAATKTDGVLLLTAHALANGQLDVVDGALVVAAARR